MKNLFHSVSEIQNLLHGEGIYTIVIGGLAVAAWGEPRVTRDIDLKIYLGRNNSDHLLTILGANYHTLVSNPVEMLRTRGLIFLHDKTGTRFDLLLADTTYDEIAIQRGINVEVQPGSTIRILIPILRPVDFISLTPLQPPISVFLTENSANPLSHNMKNIAYRSNCSSTSTSTRYNV